MGKKSFIIIITIILYSVWGDSHTKTHTQKISIFKLIGKKKGAISDEEEI